MAWKPEETTIEILFLVSRDLRGGVSHESGISSAKSAKMFAKNATKKNEFSY